MAPCTLVERTSVAGISVFNRSNFLNGVITVNKGRQVFHRSAAVPAEHIC